MSDFNFSREGSKEQFEKFKQLPDHVLADAYMMIKNGHEATFMDSYVNEKPYADRVRKLLDSGSLDFFTSTPMKWVYKFFAYLDYCLDVEEGVYADEYSLSQMGANPAMSVEAWLEKEYPTIGRMTGDGIKLTETYAQYVINCARGEETAEHPREWMLSEFDLLSKLYPEAMAGPATLPMWQVMGEYAAYRHDLFNNQQNRGGVPTPTLSNHSGEEEEEVLDSFIQFLLDGMAPFARESLKWSYFAKKEEFLNRR